MKNSRFSLTITFCICALTSGLLGQQTAAPQLSEDATAWLNVRAAMFTGDSSRETPKEPAARKAALAGQAARFTAAADRAKDFYTKFPAHPKADEARAMEVQALLSAAKAGDATNEGRLNFTVEALRADTKVAVKFRAQAVAMHAFHQGMRGKKTKADRFNAIEQVARNLMGDFPTEPQGYESLLTVAQATDDEVQARRIAADLLKAPAGETVKANARSLLGRMDLVGKPLSVELDGADAKTAKGAAETGRAVVIYTWATWSPGSLDLAAKLKQRGVNANVIALNVDTDTPAAEALAAKENLLGTAVYDERGLEGALAQRLKIRAAPQVIIVDASGKIRDVRGEADLDNRLKALGL